MQPIDSALLTAFRHWRRNPPYASRLMRPAVDALAKAREDVANGRTRYGYPIAGPSWYGRQPIERGVTYGRATQFFEAPESEAGFRVVGFSDQLVRLRHRGWYTQPEPFQHETLRGAVLQLPGHKGASRFVAAYQESMTDGYVVDLSTVYQEDSRAWGYDPARADVDSIRAAAYAADSFAEREAEKEREYQTAWAAGNLWADLGERIKAARREALAILAERRRVKGVEAPALCAAITDSVRRILDTIHQAREEREKLASGDDESLYFYPGKKRLREAFNEGAGAAVLA